MLLSDIIEACLADPNHYVAWTVSPRDREAGSQRFMCHAIRKYLPEDDQSQRAGGVGKKYPQYRKRIESYIDKKYHKLTGIRNGEVTLSTYLTEKTGHAVGVDDISPERRALAEKFWRKFIQHLRKTGE